MTDAADDFDALFEEVAAQRASTPAAEPAPAPVAVAVADAAGDDDDLESLFDQVSAAAPAVLAAAPVSPRAGEGARQDHAIHLNEPSAQR